MAENKGSEHAQSNIGKHVRDSDRWRYDETSRCTEEFRMEKSLNGKLGKEVIMFLFVVCMQLSLHHTIIVSSNDVFLRQDAKRGRKPEVP